MPRPLLAEACCLPGSCRAYWLSALVRSLDSVRLSFRRSANHVADSRVGSGYAIACRRTESGTLRFIPHSANLTQYAGDISPSNLVDWSVYGRSVAVRFLREWRANELAVYAVRPLGLYPSGAKSSSPAGRLIVYISYVRSADDMGQGDVGYTAARALQPGAGGSRWQLNSPQTPNLDALASSSHSIRFDSWYSGSAVCSPTRSSLLR